MSCSHPEKCAECAYVHFAYKKFLATFDIDENMLKAEFNGVDNDEYLSTEKFYCTGCGDEGLLKHSVCLKCKDDYCSKCGELHSCHICNTIGCAFCVSKCPRCNNFSCGECFDKCLPKDCPHCEE